MSGRYLPMPMADATTTPDDEMLIRPQPKRRRLWRKLVAVLVLLAAAPFALTLVYAVVPPISLPMIGRAVMLKDVDRRWTPIDRIAPALPMAVLSSEDARFCMHNGVDFDAIELVLHQGGDKGPSRGASTIAMQVAKNLYLWYLPTLVRKGAEIPLALWIDLVWSKQRVIEVYLNIAEWGEGIYGAEAASQYYFSKPASALTKREASLLAVALPNPIKRDAGDPSKRLRGLANLIATRARASGQILDCVKDAGK